MSLKQTRRYLLIFAFAFILSSAFAVLKNNTNTVFKFIIGLAIMLAAVTLFKVVSTHLLSVAEE